MSSMKLEDKQMKTLNQFYIDGLWVEPLSDATFPIMNPASNTQIGSVAMVVLRMSIRLSLPRNARS